MTTYFRFSKSLIHLRDGADPGVEHVRVGQDDAPATRMACRAS